LPAKINSVPKSSKSATSKEITEGYGFPFGHRLSSFMNPRSLSDGNLPEPAEDDMAASLLVCRTER
jgi:hypothetical protein